MTLDEIITKALPDAKTTRNEDGFIVEVNCER